MCQIVALCVRVVCLAGEWSGVWGRPAGWQYRVSRWFCCFACCADNASELRRKLNLLYNRKRQAKITTELTEIVAGANA